MKVDRNDLMDNMLSVPLSKADPELHHLIAEERKRQQYGLSLVASESIAGSAVLEILSSCLGSKYCEGVPSSREHGSNKYLDLVEHMCRERALQAFGLEPTDWGANVQPYSGTPANAAVYTALLEPHDRIMYLDVLDGGHLSHGYVVTKRIAGASIYFETMPYKVDPRTGLIDYEELAKLARLYKPQLIIAGSSSYSRCLDYGRFRQVADEVGAYLMADAGQVAGLVQAGVIPSPFLYCDVVTVSTQHTLLGPRAAIIFFKKGKRVGSSGRDVETLSRRLSQGVFPGPDQGPALMLAGRASQIAAVSYALQQTRTPEFNKYQRQVVKNAKALCMYLQQRKYKIVSEGTDTHLLLVDLRPQCISGKLAEFVLEKINITCNRSPVPGDTNLEAPSGIRLGTPVLTARGLDEGSMETVADFIHRGLTIAQETLWVSSLKSNDIKTDIMEDKTSVLKIAMLRNEVVEFTAKIPFPALHDL